MKICSMEGCDKKVEAYGLCKKHYRQTERGRFLRQEERKRYYARESGRLKQKEYKKSKNGREIKKREKYRRRLREKTFYEKFTSLEIFERDNWICKICGEPVDKELKFPHPNSATLDHIFPLSRGGGHTRENTQLAHAVCNFKKGAKLPFEGGGRGQCKRMLAL